MTNVSGPGKVAVRNFLRSRAIKELEKLGYRVERIPRAGKGSLRRLVKDGVAKKVTIRTSQDTWIAFPRNSDDTGWSTLEDADLVVAASLTMKDGDRANFHIFDADDIRARFDRALAARKKANHVIPAERGIWISLYHEEATDPVSLVGAGAGLDRKTLLAEDVAVEFSGGEVADEDDDGLNPPPPPPASQAAPSPSAEDPLTIAEAKRRLALTFGVDPSAIKITVEG
ncbi:MAG: hypothetical protein ACOY5Y_12175 [Pseudomonadota bacterium]